MQKDIEVVANDLKIFFKGFETALAEKNVDDAIRYLRDMRKELNDNLDFLVAKKESTQIQEVLQKNLQESIDEYRQRIKSLEEELKKR